MESHYRKTLRLAIPVCLSQFGHIMVGVVDTAMVGSIGSTEQAAVALANTFYTLVMVFGLGVSYGVTPLAASADARGDKAELTTLLRHSIAVNTLLGLLLFGVLVSVSPLLSFLQQKEEVVNLAIPFLNVLLFGMVPLCVFSGFKQFAEGMSDTRAAMLITIGANLLNILFNWVLIFGHWGFPAMGMMGSCWASFIARVLMALAMFLYVYYYPRYHEFRAGFSMRGLSKDLARKLLAIGAPSGLQWVFEVSAFSFAVIMIGWIGAREQAAHQVALSLAAVTYMIASGLSAATSVRVGNYFGLKDREGVRQAGFTAFKIVLFFMGGAALLFVFGRDALASLFSKEPEVLELASSLLVIAALFQLSDGVQVVGLGALRGLKDVNIPTVVTLIAYWVFGLPCSYILAFPMGLGVQGVWYGLSLALLLVAVALVWRFNYVSRKV